MNFFGKETDIPVGPAYLALASGAPVIPVFVPMEKNGTYATIMDEAIYFTAGHDQRTAVIRTGMERLVSAIERAIRLYPDQWYNLYDFFGVVSDSESLAVQK
jgi:KDO2-lipid IV(A) lauroyltransferase